MADDDYFDFPRIVDIGLNLLHISNFLITEERKRATSTTITMGVTELALLHLKNGEDIIYSDPNVKRKLLEAMEAQASHSGYPAYLFSQIEDSSYVYVIGGWSSVASHMEDWVPSKVNQDNVAFLADAVEVVWVQHIDIPPTTQKIPIEAPVLAISRYFVSTTEKSTYDHTFSGMRHQIDEHTAPWPLGGGWRLDCPSQSEDEYVLLTGWSTLDDHLRFEESDAFTEWGRPRQSVKGVEIEMKHARRWTGDFLP